MHGAAAILGQYVEVKSGRRNYWVQLEAAIAHAKLRGATQLITKLDWLSRNTSFIFALWDYGIDFIAICPMPIR